MTFRPKTLPPLPWCFTVRASTFPGPELSAPWWTLALVLRAASWPPNLPQAFACSRPTMGCSLLGSKPQPRAPCMPSPTPNFFSTPSHPSFTGETSSRRWPHGSRAECPWPRPARQSQRPPHHRHGPRRNARNAGGWARSYGPINSAISLPACEPSICKPVAPGL